MTGLYKYSQFNIIADEKEDKILLFNTYTLNYMWIDKSDLCDIKDKSNIDICDVPEYLAEKGFIIDESIDELQKLKNDIEEYNEKTDFMFISIFTTLACNYRCVYCFEKEQLCQNEHMTLETADNILDFIKRRYTEHQFTKPLKIKWFGGEPLLNIEIIRYISKELINNNIEFSAKLYTNGRLLTKELAQELKELHVTDEVVIPIDGLADTYSRLKGCKEEDFYKTIHNIKDIQDILKLELHINISEASKNDVAKLIKLLRENYKIKSFIRTVTIAPQNTDIKTDENSISFDEFQKASNILLNNMVMAIRRNYGCEARHPDYYVVGTKGELYICEHLVGQEKYITGNIKDQYGRIDRQNTFWDNNRILNDCKDCPILPICLGQCASQRYIDNIDCEKDKRIEKTKSQLLKIASQKK